ncbi:MAG: TIGR01777 family oxidoreductase [Ilumatobacter sp.]
MEIAVTGSTGLIGTAFVRAAEAMGHGIVRVVRRSPGTGEIGWDIDAGSIDADGFRGLDAVVHLAGEALANKKWTPQQKRVIEDSRIKSTALLSNALSGLDSAPTVMLNGGAVGIYGNRMDERLTEKSPPGDSYLAKLCVDWEAAANSAVEAGIRVAHLRTGIVLSTQSGALAEQLPFFKAGLGGRVGNGRQFWSWISIHDQVEAMLHLLESDLSGPVNFTGPEPVRNTDYVQAIAHAVRRPAKIPTPTIALDLKLGREAVREMLFASQRAVPQALLDDGYAFRHSTIEEALDDVLLAS